MGVFTRSSQIAQNVLLIADDASTSAWANAVITNGGTVSGPRRSLINDLIVGAKSDGWFQKLDRTWIYSGENQPSALTDIIATALATNIGATTFTIDRGFTGNTTSMYIDSNFNPSTASSPKYIQDSACMFVWNNTSGIDANALCGYITTSFVLKLYPEYTSGNCSWSINGSGGGFAFDGRTGLYLMSRTSSSFASIDVNGVQMQTDAGGSFGPQNEDFTSLRGEATISARQCCAFGFGAGLTPTDRTNINARLRTYMTAVGVP
jgi:hypothetical protein